MTDSVVTLEVPADVAYVGVVRSLAANLAARLPFTIDEIDDLRIAVDEAFAVLVPLAVAGSRVRAAFTVADDAIDVTVDVTGSEAAKLDRGGFGWTVLEALVQVSDIRDSGEHLGLTMRKAAEEATTAAGSTEVTGTGTP